MIESVEDTGEKEKKFKCKCDKSGVKYERIKEKDQATGEAENLSNTEAALCDEEIENLKIYIGDKIKTDCWCQYIAGFVGGS